jgi:hypothetical protein
MSGSIARCHTEPRSFIATSTSKEMAVMFTGAAVSVGGVTSAPVISGMQSGVSCLRHRQTHDMLKHNPMLHKTPAMSSNNSAQ